MQTFSSSPISAGVPDSASPFNRNVVIGGAVVIAIHAALLAIVLTLRDNPPPRPVESKTITAQLISEAPPQPVAAPAMESKPTPPAPTPAKPKPTPKVKPVTTPRVKAAPTPLPETTAPSPVAAAAPDPTPPAPPAPTAAPAPAAPAIGRPTMSISAPKDVAHLECNIATPDYPVLSRRRGESGTAIVRFVVGLTGKIENIELRKSSGSPRLDDAALDAMRASACKPYKENGEAIRAAYSQPFVFGLNE